MTDKLISRLVVCTLVAAAWMAAPPGGYARTG
jgi:hypothetical protein